MCGTCENFKTAIRQTYSTASLTSTVCVSVYIGLLPIPSLKDHNVHKTRKCHVLNTLQTLSHQFYLGEAGMTHNPQQDGPWCCQTKQKVLSLHQLLVWSDMSDHFLLKHLLHGLFYLLEEDLRNPTTQGVDCVQELGLYGVEERLEHVVLKGKLQRQRHYPVSVQSHFTLIVF